jgi:hypothetical protein
MKLSQHLDNAWCKLRTGGRHRYPSPKSYPVEEGLFITYIPACEFCGRQMSYEEREAWEKHRPVAPARSLV